MSMSVQMGDGIIVPTNSQPDGKRRAFSTTLRSLYPHASPGTHNTGDWVGLRARLDGMEKLRPIGIRSLDRQPVASRLNAVNRLINTAWVIVYVQSNTHLLCKNILKTPTLQPLYGHICTALSLGPKSTVLCN